jgi:predicted PurR-regulated permease PerM
MHAEEKPLSLRENPAGTPIATYLLLFLAFVVLAFVLRAARSILIPFALAVFLAYLLYPLVTLLTRLRIGYRLAVAIVIVLLVLLFLGTVGIVASEVNSLVGSLPVYLEKLRVHLDRAHALYLRLSERIAAFIPGRPAVAPQGGSTLPLLGSIAANFLSGLNSALSLASDFVIILFMLIFLLADARLFKRKAITAWGKKGETRAAEIVEQINRGISKFIVIRTLINLGMAAVMTVILLILKVDYAYIWGPLTGILNYIPYLGSIIAVIPPLVIALATSSSIWTPVVLLLAYIVVQNLDAYFITPQVIGRKVDLNGLAILLTLILWGFLWGPVGMILATPLTVSFKILCDNIEPLKPVGRLLGGADK